MQKDPVVLAENEYQETLVEVTEKMKQEEVQDIVQALTEGCTANLSGRYFDLPDVIENAGRLHTARLHKALAGILLENSDEMLLLHTKAIKLTLIELVQEAAESMWESQQSC